MVVRESKQINIGLQANESEQIEFEIYSREGEGEEENIHCQGEVAWSGEAAPARIDVKQLKQEMGQSRAEAGSVYAACGGMGLNYGPSCRQSRR